MKILALVILLSSASAFADGAGSLAAQCTYAKGGTGQIFFHADSAGFGHLSFVLNPFFTGSYILEIDAPSEGPDVGAAADLLPLKSGAEVLLVSQQILENGVINKSTGGGVYLRNESVTTFSGYEQTGGPFDCVVSSPLCKQSVCATSDGQ